MVKIVKDYSIVFNDAATKHIKKMYDIAKSYGLEVANHSWEGWGDYPKEFLLRKDGKRFEKQATFDYDKVKGSMSIVVYESRIKDGIYELAEEWEKDFGKDTVTIKEFCI